VTPRQKNMLEAFQASSHGSSPHSGADSQETTSPPNERPRAQIGLPDVSPALFAVVFGVLIIGSFFLGRWSVGTNVQAAEGVTSAPEEVVMPQAPVDEHDVVPAPMSDPAAEEVHAVLPVEAASEPASQNRMEQYTRDFLDKANSVTLRVIYYDDDEQGRERAYQTARHLEGLRFPAVNPIRKGKYVYVCVGAAPSKSDDKLMEYQRQLQVVSGPKPYGKPGDYASAFVYNIDKLIKR